MRKILFIIVVFLLSNSSVNGFVALVRHSHDHSHYNIHLELDPDNQYLKVIGQLEYLVTDDSLKQLSFLLHKKLKINYFNVAGDNSYQIDTSKSGIRWIPDAVKIIYPFDKEVSKGNRINIKFSYEGKITKWPSWSANVIGEQWTEIGLYFPWYPSFYGHFSYKVYIQTEKDYNLFAQGRPSKEGNLNVFETIDPVTDFIIFVSKDLSVNKVNLFGTSFKIVNSTLSNSTIRLIQEDIHKAYSSFSKWFGVIELEEMSLIFSKRMKGGGYTREGAIVLGGISDSLFLAERIQYTKYIAHEISHLWWNGTNSNWEDWLNESFAEYSALLIIKSIFGKEEFKSILITKKTECENTPAVWDLPRDDESAQKVLYSKGVILLNELEIKLGSNKFLELCKKRIVKKINNTNGLLTLIDEISGSEISSWFENLLKQR